MNMRTREEIEKQAERSADADSEFNAHDATL